MTTKKQVISFLENKRDLRVKEIREQLNSIYGKRIELNRDEITEHLNKLISLQNQIIDLNDKSNSFKTHYFSIWTPMYNYLKINTTWEQYNQETGHLEIKPDGIEDYLYEKSQYHTTKDGSQKLLKKLESVKEEWNSLIKQLRQFSSAKEMIEILKINGIEYQEVKIEEKLPSILVINKENL